MAPPNFCPRRDPDAWKLDLAEHQPHHRPLTCDEIAMLRPLFRDSIRYGSVLVHSHDAHRSDDAVMSQLDGELYVGTNHRDVFSNDYAYQTAHWQTFIHEMTHVWQVHNDHLDDRFAEVQRLQAISIHALYTYDLSSHDDLLDFNLEQQANIVADYYVSYMRGAPGEASRPPSPREAYERVLSRFLRDPSFEE